MSSSRSRYLGLLGVLAASVGCSSAAESGATGAATGTGSGGSGAGGHSATTNAAASTGSQSATNASATAGSGGSSAGSGGGGGSGPVDFKQIPPGCETVSSNLGTGKPGKFWQWQKKSSVEYGDNQTVAGIDVTSYTAVWNVPGTDYPWPNAGLNTRTAASKNYYLAEGFVVPTDGSVTGYIHWTTNGSGNEAGAAYSVSACPGDFGQTGTKITEAACTAPATTLSGFSATVSAAPIAGNCTLAPGKVYYLNILSEAELPKNDVSKSLCSGMSCTPWTNVF